MIFKPFQNVLETAVLIVIFCFELSITSQWHFSHLLRVDFLDVGQGDSILIRTPKGKTILVDGGPKKNLLSSLSPLIPFWKDEFELLILTHPDLDHIEGFISLLERYRIRKVLMSGVQHSSQAYKAFLQELVKKNIPVIIAEQKKDLRIEKDLFIDVLSPDESLLKKKLDHINMTSLVLQLHYKNSRLLFTGDIEKEAEEQILLSGQDIVTDMIKIAHHGSRTSSSRNFLLASTPGEAVIMSGRKNRFQHPHLETVLALDDLGVTWGNTKEEGTMSFMSDGKKWIRR